ncbi:putative F-box protein At1g50870 [Solanum verrucosum]|uniref:putative F-box protein At1g50870 n=1 Tax=Solanum verrucosum TaxID=315347 RepID=UPI0020D079BC|nr:putative F-box protein At1g50870 [Solanum verrucosum]
MDVDVATEIMSRLPVRSLLQFKCVSKLWMTLISDPYFSKKHLNHARNDVQRIEHVQKLDFPCNDKPWRYSLYCCCNGMALMGFCNYPDKHFQLLLWNPSTRESMVLPDPKILPKDYCTWGLGYDSASDDYKILKIDDKSCSEILALKSASWRLLDKHPIDVHPMLKSTGSLYFRRGVQRDTIARATILEFLQVVWKGCFSIGRNALEILALKSGSWRIMDKHPNIEEHYFINIIFNYNHVLPWCCTTRDSLAFVHGAFHWLISSLTKYYVMSFSISDEVYRDIPLPEQMYSNFSKLCGRGVSILGGTLCAYSHCVSDWKDMFKFWVMKDYVNASWTELFTIQGHPMDYLDYGLDLMSFSKDSFIQKV